MGRAGRETEAQSGEETQIPQTQASSREDTQDSPPLPHSFICQPTPRRSQLRWGLTVSPPSRPTGSLWVEQKGATALPALWDMPGSPRHQLHSLAGGRSAWPGGGGQNSKCPGTSLILINHGQAARSRWPLPHKAHLWKSNTGGGGPLAWPGTAFPDHMLARSRCSREL